MNIKELKREVALINGAQYDLSCEADQAMLFLLASVVVGPNYQKIQRLTRLPIDLCKRLGGRARSSGIWRGHNIVHSGWDDEETGGLAFIADSLVLIEMLERA